METKNAHNLTNDFKAVQLYSLRQWSEASRFSPDGGGGPFVVLQTGIDPEDPKAAVGEFILGKSGRWLPLGLFYALPKDLRRDQYLFPSAAAAIGVLQGLTGKAQIERGEQASPEDPAASAADPLNAAIADARRQDPAKAP